MSNQLAVIRNPRLEVEDHSSKLTLMFDAWISESGAALQVIPWQDVEQILRDAKTTDVKHLDGRACWVDTDTPGIIRFVRMAMM